jgi:hypothetical protein
MTCQLIASPYPEGHLVVSPGREGGIRIGASRYAELRDALPAVPVPAWLVAAARAAWNLDVHGQAAGATVLVRPETAYGYARASYEVNFEHDPGSDLLGVFDQSHTPVADPVRQDVPMPVPVALGRLLALPGTPSVSKPRRPAAQLSASDDVRAGQRHKPQAGGACCKTVGSAYVGSNPTPATPCEDGSLAANSRLGGPFCFVS